MARPSAVGDCWAEFREEAVTLARAGRRHAMRRAAELADQAGALCGRSESIASVGIARARADFIEQPGQFLREGAA